MSNTNNYDTATALYQVGKYAESIQFYDFELAMNSQNHLAYLGRAKAHIHLNKSEDGLKDFGQCLTRVPSNQYLDFFKGILGFLKEKGDEGSIDELILSQFIKLPWHDKMQFLMQCVLQKKKKKAELIVNNFSDQEKKKAIKEVNHNVQLSVELKKDIDQLFLNYFETFREKWFNKIAAERGKIDQLGNHFPETVAAFDNLEKSLSQPFKDAQLAISILEKTNVFIAQELPSKLQMLGQKERRSSYGTLYNSNLPLINAHQEKAEEFKQLVNFSATIKGLNARNLKSAKQVVTKFNKLSLNKAGTDLEALQLAITQLPELNESIDENQAALLYTLDQKFDNLLAEKEYNTAQKIALKIKPFFPGAEKFDTIGSLKNEKAQKTKKKGLIYGAATLVILIIGYFSLGYFQESGAYNEALEANTFEGYETFKEAYPNSSYIQEIEEKQELNLYEQALLSGNLADLKLLIKEFPKSEFLVEIAIEEPQTLGYTASNESLPILNGQWMNLKGASMIFKNYTAQPIWFTVPYSVSITTLRNDPELKANRIYYCNNTKTKLLSDLKNPTTVMLAAGTPLQYLGEKSETPINFNNDGNYINEFFYRCSDPTGNVGWVNESAFGEVEIREDLMMADFNPNYVQPNSIQNSNTNTTEIVTEPVDIPTSMVEEPAVEIIDRMTCPNCNGKKKLTSTCSTSGCLDGQISATCVKCNGDYQNKSKLCPKCSGKGCSYCDGDGLACNKCDKGSTGSEKHALCNGTGKVSKSCSKCKGTGVVEN
ncbi:MAG: hypothetical protein GQ574_24300 [Crocinitomix sp.]|nr:hypothetical protein [Crocinitomix sp.]